MLSCNMVLSPFLWRRRGYTIAGASCLNGSNGSGKAKQRKFLVRKHGGTRPALYGRPA
ncbi:MAG: hypothetical protein LZF60_140056 [Nitrospira sp.]|nr:MAG: hypothetical protein LZF60_140056 [Nitrospira sp.]